MKFLPNSSLGKDEVLQSFFWGMMKFGSDKVFSKPVKRNLCLSGSVEVEHLVSVSQLLSPNNSFLQIFSGTN